MDRVHPDARRVATGDDDERATPATSGEPRVTVSDDGASYAPVDAALALTTPGGPVGTASTPTGELLGAARRDVLVGTSIGRYKVLEKIGAGGMGVVYRALDPVLDRIVALKVLPPLDEAKRMVLEGRLRREAQALARLDHENVVAVYDVGIAEASLFVAMQFVDGATLDVALRDRPAAPRSVLALYVAAGHGLAAAHAAGIVHRDVKPSNILVDRAGRVYIGDFGLARGVNEVERTLTDSQSWLLSSEMTRVGSVVGTPRYMSPEQHRGEPTTARSDQFSFCVAVWCDVFGAHPFCPSPWDPKVALAAMERDRVIEPARATGLPARAVRALRRGLRHDPLARWPSMTSLIAELDPQHRSMWLPGGLVAIGLVGGLAVALLGARNPSDACAGAADRLAEIATPARTRALADRFAATGLPYAVDTAARVQAALASYGQAWSAMRIDACRANQTHHEPVFDRRNACLDRRLGAFDAALASLANPTQAVVDRAVDAVAALPAIEDCGDVVRLAATEAEPDNLALRGRIALVTAQLDSQHASLAAGVLVGAVPKAEALVAQARTIGWGPLLGQALRHASEAHQSINEGDLAIERMREASIEAGRARDDTAAAEAMVHVAYLLAERGKPAEALVVASDAEVLVLRAGDPPRLRGRLELARGDAFGRASRFDEADAAFARAIEITRRNPRHDELEVASILSDQAAMLKSGSRPRPARDALLEAQQIFERRLGADHPRLAGVHSTLGGVLLQLGDLPHAKQEYERAGAILEARFPSDSAAIAKLQSSLALIELRQGHLAVALAGYQGVHRRLKDVQPDHPDTYQALYMIGAIQLEQGRYEDALVTMQTVLDFRMSHLGDANIATADVIDGIANVHQARDNIAKAIELRKKSLAIREKALGPDNPDLTISLDALAFIALDQGDCKQASALAQRALDILDRAHSHDHMRINSLDTIGACEAKAGRLVQARATLEKALAFAEVKGNGRVEQRGNIRSDLAEVLWKSGDRAGARKLVGEAIAIFEGASRADLVAEQKKWLAAHPP